MNVIDVPYRKWYPTWEDLKAPGWQINLQRGELRCLLVGRRLPSWFGVHIFIDRLRCFLFGHKPYIETLERSVPAPNAFQRAARPGERLVCERCGRVFALRFTGPMVVVAGPGEFIKREAKS